MFFLLKLSEFYHSKVNIQMKFQFAKGMESVFNFMGGIELIET